MEPSVDNIYFEAPGTIMSIRTMADRGIRITLDTQELDPAQVAALMMMLKTTGNFAFVTSANPEDIFSRLEAPKEIVEGKNLSEADYTRNIIFALAQQLGEDWHDIYHKEYKKFQAYLKRKFPQPKE